MIFLSCGTDKTDWIDKRNENFDGGSIDIQPSQLSLPVNIPLDQIEQTLNKKIPTTLVKNRELKAGVLLTIERNGALVLAGSGYTMEWSVPLKIMVGHKIIGGTITEFEIHPIFLSLLTINEDYSIGPKTQLIEVNWVNDAAINVLGMEIDITEQIDNLLDKETDKITRLIDRELQKINLQKILKKTWLKLSNPIRVNRKIQPVYLMVDATKLQLRNYQFSKDQLAIQLGVFGMLNTVFDSASHAHTGIAFPPFEIQSTGSSVSTLYVPLVLSYDRINSLLKQNRESYEFVVEGQQLMLDSVNLTSVDSFLLITAAISGDVNAVLQVLGRPAYDPQTKVLTVKGFDFNMVKSDESLLSVGDFFFHEEIIDEVLTKLTIPLGSLIDTIPNLIYAGVEKGKSGDKLNLETAIDSIAVDQLKIRYNDISLVLYVRGSMDVTVEKIKLKNQ
ncbi:MAG: DUF4403 family protein [Salibacteraceae bacterium]